MKSFKVDLSNCDREPIHIPGSIQPHGCLIACDDTLNIICRYSINTTDFLGIVDHELLDERLENVLGPATVHDMRNALAITGDGSRPALLLAVPCKNGHVFDIAVHRYDGHAIVELEAAGSEKGRPLGLARAVIGRLGKLSSVKEMLDQTPKLMRGAFGYDRVMVYRFLHDGSGQVVAETKIDRLESFLGQYFPASDIPQQARELYLKNTIRIISDASCNRIPIEPELDTEGKPLDLSFAHLRSVSPIHCEYLRNMGVAASMSISIIVSGELWGLIACHHYAPRTLSMTQRIAAEMFGDFFSIQLQATLQKARLDAAITARRSLDVLQREIAHNSDIHTYLRDNVHRFRPLMPCDGVGLWLDGTWASEGATPPKEMVPKLAQTIAEASAAGTWTTHSLSAELSEAESFAADVSGVLAVPLSQVPRDFLLFFRKEVVQTVEWAGNPNKTYDTGALGDRLTPRKSFAIWKQTVERQSRPWTAEDRDIAEAIRTALLEVIMRQTELLSSERQKADVRQKILNEELNHRVKNILALIKSVVSQSTEGRSLEEYVSALKGRIMALSVAHDQVIRHDGGGRLRELIDAELIPHRGGGAKIELEGPDVALDSRAYSVMALVIHEMATNAAKYGALSRDRGHLAVHWTYDAVRGCEVRWKETGSEAVAPPSRRGFGAVLVDRSIPFDLAGESELKFEAGGVSARFLVPAKFISLADSQMAEQPQKSAEETAPVRDIADLDVLVVEDQLLIAMDLEAMLADLGVKSITTAATATEALRVLNGHTPSVAILDVNLGMGTSLAVADELLARNIPFIFSTGYGDTANIPASMRAVRVLRKPYDASNLRSTLALTLSQA